MRLGVKQYLEDVLVDYPRTKGYIQRRLAELDYPFQSDKDDVLIENGTDMLAMTIASDRRLSQLELNYRCVTYCLNRTDELTREIIKSLYFDEHPNLTLTGVGMNLHVDKATISKRRKKFFTELASELGLIDSEIK